MKIQEVFDAIQEVNECEHELECPAHLITDGWCFKIVWLGVTIWSSEDDEREFFEEKNKYEPLGAYLIKMQEKTIEQIKAEMQRVVLNRPTNGSTAPRQAVSRQP